MNVEALIAEAGRHADACLADGETVTANLLDRLIAALSAPEPVVTERDETTR